MSAVECGVAAYHMHARMLQSAAEVSQVVPLAHATAREVRLFNSVLSCMLSAHVAPSIQLWQHPLSEAVPPKGTGTDDAGSGMHDVVPILSLCSQLSLGGEIKKLTEGLAQRCP